MASKKAEKVGVGFPEYVRHLLLNDIHADFDDEKYLSSVVSYDDIKKSMSDIENGDYKVLKSKSDIDYFVKNL